jgi:hypothetical protein
MKKAVVSSPPAVLWKSFPSRGAYANYALSKEAPRYSIVFDTVASPELARTFGIQEGQALFSDGVRLLQRAFLNWDVNRYEAVIARAADLQDYDPADKWDDEWRLTAGVAVPAWFVNEISGTLTPEMETSALTRENATLDLIFSGLHLRDSQAALDIEYLTKVVEVPSKQGDWCDSGCAE